MSFINISQVLVVKTAILILCRLCLGILGLIIFRLKSFFNNDKRNPYSNFCDGR